MSEENLFKQTTDYQKRPKRTTCKLHSGRNSNLIPNLLSVASVLQTVRQNKHIICQKTLHTVPDYTMRQNSIHMQVVLGVMCETHESSVCFIQHSWPGYTSALVIVHRASLSGLNTNISIVHLVKLYSFHWHFRTYCWEQRPLENPYPQITPVANFREVWIQQSCHCKTVHYAPLKTSFPRCHSTYFVLPLPPRQEVQNCKKQPPAVLYCFRGDRSELREGRQALTKNVTSEKRTHQHAKTVRCHHLSTGATALSASQTSIREPSADALKPRGDTHINMSIPYLG